MSPRGMWLMATLLGVGLSIGVGCDRQSKPSAGKGATSTTNPAAPVAATQPAAGDLSAIQRMVADSGGSSEGSAATSKLPPGHPPVPGSPGRQAVPNPNLSPGRPPTDVSGAAQSSAEAPVEATPLKWEAPVDWKPVKPGTSFRLAQYEISGVEGEAPGEVTVFHFPGTGGPVEDNVIRWIGQFSDAEGKAIDPAAAKRETFEVGGRPVHYVEVSGYMMIGKAMGGTGERSMGEYRLLGGIVEMPDGNWFFKGTGPDKTMAAAREVFLQMLKSVHE